MPDDAGSANRSVRRANGSRDAPRPVRDDPRQRRHATHPDARSSTDDRSRTDDPHHRSGPKRRSRTDDLNRPNGLHHRIPTDDPHHRNVQRRPGHHQIVQHHRTAQRRRTDRPRYHPSDRCRPVLHSSHVSSHSALDPSSPPSCSITLISGRYGASGGS